MLNREYCLSPGTISAVQACPLLCIVILMLCHHSYLAQWWVKHLAWWYSCWLKWIFNTSAVRHFTQLCHYWWLSCPLCILSLFVSPYLLMMLCFSFYSVFLQVYSACSLKPGNLLCFFLPSWVFNLSGEQGLVAMTYLLIYSYFSIYLFVLALVAFLTYYLPWSHSLSCILLLLLLSIFSHIILVSYSCSFPMQLTPSLCDMSSVCNVCTISFLSLAFFFFFFLPYSAIGCITFWYGLIKFLTCVISSSIFICCTCTNSMSSVFFYATSPG